MASQRLTDILAMLPEDKREQFVTFVQTGDADADYLRFLRHDACGQRALRAAYEMERLRADRLAAAIRNDAGPVDLKATDWMEIYYALYTKREWAQLGEYDRVPGGKSKKAWASQLGGIMKKIGGDGDKAATRGVNPCIFPQRETLVRSRRR